MLGELPHGLGVGGEERRLAAEQALVPGSRGLEVAHEEPGEEIDGHGYGPHSPTRRPSGSRTNTTRRPMGTSEVLFQDWKVSGREASRRRLRASPRPMTTTTATTAAARPTTGRAGREGRSGGQRPARAVQTHVGAAGEQPSHTARPLGVDHRDPSSRSVELGAHPGGGEPGAHPLRGAATGGGDDHGGVGDLEAQPVPGPDQPTGRVAPGGSVTSMARSTSAIVARPVLDGPLATGPAASGSRRRARGAQRTAGSRGVGADAQGAVHLPVVRGESGGSVRGTSTSWCRAPSSITAPLPVR